MIVLSDHVSSVGHVSLPAGIRRRRRMNNYGSSHRVRRLGIQLVADGIYLNSLISDGKHFISGNCPHFYPIAYAAGSFSTLDSYWRFIARQIESARKVLLKRDGAPPISDSAGAYLLPRARRRLTPRESGSCRFRD